ncbi:uncharacterized protein [Henckelia pumila]|uniref:uncharacterized protein n=1 Tax=Henckelia pumila TaxID=405737 RepID=UPI003C6E310F
MADEERRRLEGDAENNSRPVYRSMIDSTLPSIKNDRPSIIRPTIAANHFEIKPYIIQMGVSDDAICLRLFCFSLRYKAKAWLKNLLAGSITTWEDLAKAFLTKYFPPSKSMKLRADITTFSQGEQEKLYEAWERYKDILKRCPHQTTRLSCDAVAGGNLLRKSPEDGYELIEKMTSSSYHPPSERNATKRSAGMHQIDAFTSVAAQLEVKAVELRSGKRVEPERQELKEPEVTILEKTASKSFNSTQPPTSQNNFVIPPPFPAALKKAKLESQFAKFLEVFKKLNINITFADALMQMPNYSKFLKEILSNKRKLEENAMISLTQNCFALVQNKIPPKQKDPGSFSIPCMINDVSFHKVLCDLGARINLMPYSVFRKLSSGEPKPTKTSLQLADRSLKYQRGIIEDVLVKVDKFIFSVDFVVLDMEKDLDMPLILGRPFLATGKTLIDVQKGELLLRDTLQEPLESAFVSSFHEDEINVGLEEMTAYLNDNQSWKKGGKLKLEDLDEMGTKLLNVLKSHKSVFALKKKGEITVIRNEQNDLIPTRTVTGYNQIAIAPEDQDKTTFTCPYGTFSYRRMPFGLCNAPATFQRCMMTIFHDMAFKTLREKLVTAPVLTSPNWDLPFEVICDASDSAVGAVLGQRIDNVFHTIYYARKNLNEAQLNYATTEKELLAIIFAIDKFHSYLVLSKITFFTDHSAIRHLLAKKDAKPWLIKWIMLLQELDLEIKDKKVEENFVADHLSRLEYILECSQNDTEEIDNLFPDE